MLSPKHMLALAVVLAAGLSACSGGTNPSSERSGTYGGRTTVDDDRGPQARNASPYMRQ